MPLQLLVHDLLKFSDKTVIGLRNNSFDGGADDKAILTRKFAIGRGEEYLISDGTTGVITVCRRYFIGG